MSKIVYKITPDMDITQIEATTYQMRNFYRQFGDGFFSVLDVMNYIQHHWIVKLCKPGYHVLDMCCGRGLLLPMLRYQRKEIASYTGVDLATNNATFLRHRVTDGKPIESDYYPFPVHFLESNVAEMAGKLSPQLFDLIVYTSSIEHMQKETGQRSLDQAYSVSRPGTQLIITCPNTPEDQDGYDTQYAAHVYEWKRSELIQGLTRAGFEIVREWGILIDRATLKAGAERLGITPIIDTLQALIPSEWLLPVMAPLFPEQCKEIAILAKAK